MPSEPSVNDILDELARRVDARIPHDVTTDEALFAHLELLLDIADQHAHVGEEIPTDARVRPARKMLLTGLRPVTSYQREFNTRVLEVLGTLTKLVQAQGIERRPIDPQLNRMTAAIATIDVSIDEVAEQVRNLESQLVDVQHRAIESEPIDPMGRRIELEHLSNRIQELEAKVRLLQRPSTSAETGTDGTGAATSDDADDFDESTTAAMQDVDVVFDADAARFYTDLENEFRGTREEIRARQEPYVADIEAIGSPHPVIDIGSGRGEWLEVLGGHDIPAYGLDLNPVTVAECASRGLDVRQLDAMTHLTGLPDGSVTAVTGFHIAEHLPFPDLLALIDAALVALVPGGALILETPNCTNLVVGASSFYLDPTHIRPLHPLLLEFLCRQRGFASVELRYLHPRKPPRSDHARANRPGSLPEGMLDELESALFGPMDYAVVATKAGRSENRR